MADQSGEKSFEATQHRKDKAREQGQVPYSQDLGSALLLIVGAGLMRMLGGGVSNYFANLTTRYLGEPISLRADEQQLVSQANELLEQTGAVMLPFLGLLLLAGVATSILQVGFLFVPERLQPDIGRINPLKGFGRIFSSQGAAKLGFGLFKVLIVAAVSVAVLWSRQSQVLEAAALDTMALATLLFNTGFETMFWVGFALLVLALADFAFQKWKHSQDLMMTAQEMKEEMKNLQGNPEVAARRRQVQRQMALNRIGSEVPKADVVVTNPTELAIAISYDPETMASPVVVAKGADNLAARIRRLALEHDVPVVERKPLARLLYKEVDIGHPVPSESFAAVAEVLAYVYQLKGKKIPPLPRAA
ncbi:Flagellar biosynthetic protein FlhB [Pseudobythopirellula maris]|uniref:Flagellar biosynthetic protein FlhB n=1 Tax=Pseudobythopirellula maris TaxID=2527991 RepID=A0A5C5ZGQ8_9BACT|nr:flagellar biosynthesis protein FlhB [Pseudobythopirellula maris]TWT86504.1 Flagellar biosynthetic protein FlhB [Pseudobythopirellula maris]